MGWIGWIYGFLLQAYCLARRTQFHTSIYVFKTCDFECVVGCSFIDEICDYQFESHVSRYEL